MGKGSSGKFANTYGAKVTAVLPQNNASIGSSVMSDAPPIGMHHKSKNVTEQTRITPNREDIDRAATAVSNAKWNTAPAASEGHFALFDGEGFYVVKDGKIIDSFDAISGNRGYHTAEFQELRDKGPFKKG